MSMRNSAGKPVEEEHHGRSHFLREARQLEALWRVRAGDEIFVGDGFSRDAPRDSRRSVRGDALPAFRLLNAVESCRIVSPLTGLLQFMSRLTTRSTQSGAPVEFG